mgnify:CR=1 FL=1
MDQGITVAELVAVLRRRLALLVLIAAIGSAASIYHALRLPPVYRTATRVLVERQQIPDELARSTVNLTTSQRLQLIEERLMARDNLIALIDRLDIFGDAPVSPERKIEIVRAATRIESISGVNPGQSWGAEAGIFAFTITVEFDDPRLAAAMANAFAADAIAQNALVRTERARDTLRYFEREVERLVAQIVALETKIATFKTANEEALPESLEYRREELARLQLNEFELMRRISDLQNERSVLSVEMASEAEASPLRESAAEIELRQLELQLAQQRRLLKAGHPQIRQLESRIDALTDLVASITVDADGARRAVPGAERDALRLRIAQVSTQLDLLEGQGAALAGRRAALDASIRGTPEVEAELAAYNRGLVELQEQHSVAARRLAEAQTGEQLEVNDQAERFQVVEEAPVPSVAVGPNRKKVAVVGGGAGVALAIGLVALLEVLRPVLRSSVQMERQLGIRPVVSIPHVTTKWERRRRRRRWLAAGVLLTGTALAAPPIIARFAPSSAVEVAAAGLHRALASLGLGS